MTKVGKPKLSKIHEIMSSCTTLHKTKELKPSYVLFLSSFSIHLVPKPGWSSKASSRFSMAGFPGASLLYKSVIQTINSHYLGNYEGKRFANDSLWLAYLKKVYCSPYIQGCNSTEGYLPKGGTMRLKSKATRTNRAGRTI